MVSSENWPPNGQLEAALALRSLWAPAKAESQGHGGPLNGTNGEGSNEDVGHSSRLHRDLRAEVDDVLKSGLLRRMARLEKQVKLLWQDDGLIGAEAENGAHEEEATSAPAAAQRPCNETAAQTEGGVQDLTAAQHLAETVAKALRRANRCAEPLKKVYGPTDQQEKLPDPPGEKDDGPVRETVTLRSTLSCLEQNLSSRSRQIGNLSKQLDHVEKEFKGKSIEAEEAIEKLEKLRHQPMQQIHAERLQTRRKRVLQMESNLKESKEKAKVYQALAHQQRAFFLQSERVSAIGGKEVMSRHPAGEIFLVPTPASMEDDNVQTWDVGCAIANPYICDSWPFEPNVLARRGPQESSMPPFAEETEEDLEEENKRFRNPFRPGLSLRMPPPRGGNSDDEDFDDRYGGQTETARSL